MNKSLFISVIALSLLVACGESPKEPTTHDPIDPQEPTEPQDPQDPQEVEDPIATYRVDFSKGTKLPSNNGGYIDMLKNLFEDRTYLTSIVENGYSQIRDYDTSTGNKYVGLCLASKSYDSDLKFTFSSQVKVGKVEVEAQAYETYINNTHTFSYDVGVTLKVNDETKVLPDCNGTTDSEHQNLVFTPQDTNSVSFVAMATKRVIIHTITFYLYEK